MPRGRLTTTSPVARTTGRQASSLTVSNFETAQEHVKDLVKLAKRSKVKVGRQDYYAKSEFPNGDWSDGDVVLMLDKLSPRQVTYAVARVYGMNVYSAAAQIGLANASEINTFIYTWEDEPWWPVILDRERHRAFGNKGQALFHLSPHVIRRLTQEVLGQHGDKLAHEAAVYIGDQIWGRATQTNVNREEDVDTRQLAQELVTEMVTITQNNRALFEQDRAKALTDGNEPGEDRLVQPDEGTTDVSS